MHDTRWIHCHCCAGLIRFLNKVIEYPPETGFEVARSRWLPVKEGINIKGTRSPRTVDRKKKKKKKKGEQKKQELVAKLCNDPRSEGKNDNPGWRRQNFALFGLLFVSTLSFYVGPSS